MRRRTGQSIDIERQTSFTVAPGPVYTNTDSSIAPSAGGRLTITATASVTPHTKPTTFTEVIAATTMDITSVEMQVYGTSVNTTDTSALMDLAVGAALSEVVVVDNIAVGYKSIAVAASSANGSATYTIPIFIPKGSRISIRMQSAVSLATATVQFRFARVPYSRYPSTKLLTMGADTATSKGVTLATAAADSKAAWTEIVSATTEALDGLLIGIQAAADTVINAGYALLDIGIGASGSEVAVVIDVSLRLSSTEAISVVSPAANYFRYPIAKGTRISVRWSRANTTDSADVILYGVRRA